MKTMTKREIVGLIADLIAIGLFIMTGIPTINNWIDSLRPPPTFTFYFLAFWALVAATFGGLVWNFLMNQDLRVPEALLQVWP